MITTIETISEQSLVAFTLCLTVERNLLDCFKPQNKQRAPFVQNKQG